MIIIVLPILTLLMFDLGLTLKLNDFTRVARHPRAAITGILGQIVVLPTIATLLAIAMHLPPLYFVGLVLIACCPGGSSSNVFSMLAGGDVALSVTLTAVSSIITLFTLPIVMTACVNYCGAESQAITLPVGNLLIQNLLLMFLPIVVGIAMRRYFPNAAMKTERVLSRLTFPLLMLLAGIFFMQNFSDIAANISTLGFAATVLLIAATGAASLMARAARLSTTQRRTIVIEVGMQNAAQAIAIASSPFIFNNSTIAIPAIIYALMMNVVLLTYVGVIKGRTKRTVA